MNTHQTQRTALLTDIPFFNVLRGITNGMRSGKGQFLLVTFAAANTDTDFATSLGRIPNFYVDGRRGGAGFIYDASDGTGHWTGTNIRLRATAIGSYTVWIV